MAIFNSYLKLPEGNPSWILQPGNYSRVICKVGVIQKHRPKEDFCEESPKASNEKSRPTQTDGFVSNLFFCIFRRKNDDNFINRKNDDKLNSFHYDKLPSGYLT